VTCTRTQARRRRLPYCVRAGLLVWVRMGENDAAVLGSEGWRWASGAVVGTLRSRKGRPPMLQEGKARKHPQIELECHYLEQSSTTRIATSSRHCIDCVWVRDLCFAPNLGRPCERCCSIGAQLQPLPTLLMCPNPQFLIFEHGSSLSRRLA
jgi:hypothetical protein